MTSINSDSDSFRFAGKNLKTSFYGAELLKPPLEMPWNYKVSVQLLIPLSPPEIHTAEDDTLTQ